MGSEILEIGLGEGNYFDYFPPIKRYVGLDINKSTVATLKQQNPDRDYRAGDVTDAGLFDLLGRQPFDSVVCCNVIEHVKDDTMAVSNILTCLKPGGHIFLFVPAFEALFNDMDRLAGHQRRYTRLRLLDTLPDDGVSILKSSYFNPVGGMAWWIQKFTEIKDLNSPDIRRKIVFFDRWILPVSRLLNPLTRKFFGQSVYLIAKKI